MDPRATDVTKRHDFLMLFDVQDGNPNGDPDGDNVPRMDYDTQQGLVTDVCLKRKVRDYVGLRKAGKDGYQLYIANRALLLDTNRKMMDRLVSEGAIKIPDPPPAKTSKKADSGEGEKEKTREQDLAQALKDQQASFYKSPTPEALRTIRRAMCEQYYDVRAFGAVMGFDVNCGQVRGPIQLTFARSIDPITPMDITITRVARVRNRVPSRSVTPHVADEEVGEEALAGQMGHKHIVPYGLYQVHGFFSPPFAEDTGFAKEDLALFFEALINMWDLDHSSARGLMSCRGLYVFNHDDAFGSAPAHELFNTVAVRCREGVTAPRSYRDYEVNMAEEDLPEGVTLSRLVEF